MHKLSGAAMIFIYAFLSLAIGAVSGIVIFFVCLLFYGTPAFKILAYLPFIGGTGVIIYSFYRFFSGSFTLGHKKEKEGKELFDVLNDVRKNAPLTLSEEDTKKSSQK